MATILVVDDDRSIRRVLAGLLQEAGHSTLEAPDVDEALQVIREKSIDAIISDLKMPGKSGLDLLVANRSLKPSIPVIMITAHGNIETAVSAMKRGAFDFITKPFDEEELLRSVRKALSESEENRELFSEYFEAEDRPLPDIIGGTPLMREVFSIMEKAAPTDSTVLISGETGVGKELVARAIHRRSGRRDHPLVKVNCAALPESLLESELFGHEKGAFTGAVTRKPGRFEIADGGTLFLDEIGELPVHLQAKLLGVLQDRVVEPVGGVKGIRVDIRIVAATNRDLHEAVKGGEFRPDLFYRLNVMPVHLPPLRERKEDLAPLCAHFLGKIERTYGRHGIGIAPETMECLAGHDWPGNIRELENTLERMVLMAEGDVLGPELVPFEVKAPSPPGGASSLKEKVAGLTQSAERQLIVEALEKTGQNRTRAAALLGISRRALQNKIKTYGL
jgi:two-component system NtrC family response regulator